MATLRTTRKTKKSQGLKAIKDSVKKKTQALEIGKVYFLSSFYDKEGAWIAVLDKSTKINKCGWPSTVTYEVIEKVGNTKYYQEGNTGTCNASNLYKKREQASRKARFRKKIL